jgi:hypothetical protein
MDADVTLIHFQNVGLPCSYEPHKNSYPNPERELYRNDAHRNIS